MGTSGKGNCTSVGAFPLDCAEASKATSKHTFPSPCDRAIDTAPGTSKCCNCGDSKDFGHICGAEKADAASLQSADSFVCRICHINENCEKLISPCLCRGSLAYVHNDCLERWISMSRCTTCELCQFQYQTEQTLRYTFYQSLRLWYSRSMSRRALQEDCQMFLLLTLIAFGIVGTLLLGVQYYILKGQINGVGRVWTKGWLIFFLFTTLIVYLINVYMIIKSQLMPWYRWWQSARDIRLVLEKHKTTCTSINQTTNDEKFKSSPLAAEGSITQTGQICTRQLNSVTEINNNTSALNENQAQAVGATCQNSNNQSSNHLDVVKENALRKACTAMSASYSAAARRTQSTSALQMKNDFFKSEQHKQQTFALNCNRHKLKFAL